MNNNNCSMNSVSSEAGNNNNTKKIRFYEKSAFVGLIWVPLSFTEPVSPCPRQDNGSLSLANGSKVEKQRESVCYTGDCNPPFVSCSQPGGLDTHFHLKSAPHPWGLTRKHKHTHRHTRTHSHPQTNQKTHTNSLDSSFPCKQQPFLPLCTVEGQWENRHLL